MEQVSDNRQVAFYANIGHAMTHMVTILYATAVLHLPALFGLPYGQMLGLASFGLVLYGVAALPAGWLGDRWSQVGMIVVLFVGIGASLLIIGTATGTVQLFIGLSLLGLFASIYHPVGIAWLVASARKQGMTLGINGLFGGLGSALAAPFVGLMIDHFSWREAFLLPAAGSILAGLALFVAWRRGIVTDIRQDRVETPPPGGDAMRRAFIVLTVTMACSGFVYAGIVNTMPKVFETGLGPGLVASYTEIGVYVGIVVGIASLSSIAGGWLADRMSARSVYILLWGLQIVPLYLVTSFFGVGLMAIMAAVLVLHTGFVAAENMLVARYTPFEWRGLAYGAKFVLALGVGGLTVELASILFDATGGFDALYLWFAIAAAVATVGALSLPNPRRAPVTAAATDG